MLVDGLRLVDASGDWNWRRAPGIRMTTSRCRTGLIRAACSRTPRNDRGGGANAYP